MGYKHDIFVSYRWRGDIKEWVDFVFVPILRNVLEELKTETDTSAIFHDDDRTLSGANVPSVLRDGVGNSKCMVCVMTTPYFTNSYWCSAELSAMLRREEETGARNNPDHTGLIFPVIFVDENEREPENRSILYSIAQARQLFMEIRPLELNEEKFYCVAAGFKGTTSYDELRFAIRKWVKKSILPKLKEPPKWQAGWNEEDYFISRFNNLTAPPKNFVLPSL